MMIHMKIVSVLFLILIAVSGLRAGVVVTENIGKGDEEKWPKKPDLAVVENPKLSGAPQVVNAKTRVSQSFTTSRKLTLAKIMIRYKAEEGAGKFALRIQEVPEGHESLVYAEGKDLFPEPLIFECSVSTGGEARFLEINLTENAGITLESRKTYVVEMVGVEGKGLAWLRRAADEYPKGRAYVDRAQLSGNDDARDLSLALFAD